MWGVFDLEPQVLIHRAHGMDAQYQYPGGQWMGISPGAEAGADAGTV